ncbi:hypothetical protein FZC77_22245 [Bacillus swezeyi]|uniref:Uncharacterized protein n=1 Tax=Bacillus swezeyi TaxID=1925020 RepID=A0A5M8RIJ3_9BACI|nr:hypothetical protein DX927_23635 [Bacillus swezeyi]TYS32356.1 hypothetical protein FZC77_22245 [Bacillus swezeyi]
MNVIKKIIVGFFTCLLTFLALIYLNLYRVGVIDEWNGTFLYGAFLFSYIPIMALIEYFIFNFIIKQFSFRFSVRVTLVTLLTVLVNSMIIYFQSKQILFTGMTAISTLVMSLILPFIKEKNRTEQ